MRTVTPAVRSVWGTAKGAIVGSKAERIVVNPLVKTIEDKLDQLVVVVENKTEMLRNKQYPKELEYLEKEIQNVKKRMNESQNPGLDYKEKTDNVPK